jgi:hypothetical protein
MNNKFSFLILQQQEKRDLKALTEKVRSTINDYLQEDIDELFKNLQAYVFGGAVRDSLADQPINDIDIAILPRSKDILISSLLYKGFKPFFKTNYDIHKLYESHVIFEPLTFYKNEKFIQLIRPVSKKDDEGLQHVISNVDISCCGVSYAHGNLQEHVNDAITHCLQKQFKVNINASMCNKIRLDHRRDKLIRRGWKQIDKPCQCQEQTDDEDEYQPWDVVS